MRTKLMLFLTSLVLGMTSAVAQNYRGVVILQHNGEDTFFEAKDVQKAFDAAVDGDTIHISEGKYPNDLTLKSLPYIKSHQQFHYYLELPGNPSIDTKFIESMTNFYITVKCDLKNITFSHNYVELYVEEGFTVEKMSFDRCIGVDIDNWGGNIKSIEANNTSFGWFYNNGETPLESGYFINCHLQSPNFKVGKATFVNTIFYTDCRDCTPQTFTDCTFERCLFSNVGWLFESCEKTDCWDIEVPEDGSYVDLGKESLLANGYVDDDGSVIGCEGGSTPDTGSRYSGPDIWTDNIHKKANKMSVDIYIRSE